jgi:ketosteroid isomerase-like protein
VANSRRLSGRCSSRFATAKLPLLDMDIQPKEMRIQLFGDVAIATFHLDDRAGFLNRRTIVLNKAEKGWKIVHLHASEVSVTGIAQ